MVMVVEKGGALREVGEKARLQEIKKGMRLSTISVVDCTNSHNYSWIA